MYIADMRVVTGLLCVAVPHVQGPMAQVGRKSPAATPASPQPKTARRSRVSYSNTWR